MVLVKNMVMCFTCMTFAYEEVTYRPFTCVKPSFISHVEKANNPLNHFPLFTCLESFDVSLFLHMVSYPVHKHVWSYATDYPDSTNEL